MTEDVTGYKVWLEKYKETDYGIVLEGTQMYNDHVRIQWYRNNHILGDARVYPWSIFSISDSAWTIEAPWSL